MNRKNAYVIENAYEIYLKRVDELKPKVCLHLTPVLIQQLEEMLDIERQKVTSQLHESNQFYIEFVKRSNYTYNDISRIFTYKKVNKMLGFLFDDKKQEWRVQLSGRH